MDSLTLLMDGLNLRARLIYSGGVCGRWGIDHNSDTDIWIHLVTKGDGWVHSPAWKKPLSLDSGDLILFMPHAKKHYLSYSPSELRFDHPDARKAPMAEGSIGFVCGMIELAMPQACLWRALPAEIVVRRREAGDALGTLLRLIIAEAEQDRLASVPVVERLCDGILLLVLRHCIERGLLHAGVFVAMLDARLEKVLRSMHGEPWRAWSIRDFCDQSGLSKTQLTDKFDQLIGRPPMEYLVEIRMQYAASLLRDSALSVDQLAERCGYDSTSAFSRAFKRCYGTAPGAYRRRTTGAVRLVDPTQ